ncbi:MAG TPA: LLM class flavin-dependent oxidoreductase [Ktedonobacteraceae bacterium]|nr:LLM class flavin-dependent oxidoreductase [Ktedonobacteraceae bacterium]
MTRIQFGLALPSPRPGMSHETYMAAIEKGLALVTGHFDSGWFVDHTQFGANPLLEGWTMLTYMAARHPQLDFGHAVLCQSFRNPALLAKMAATFQFLSGGRFIFGIGAGWKEDEYRAYGYDFPSAGTRVEELEETLQIVKALWHDEQGTVRGKHYQAIEAYCEPKPDPIPPIMIGGAKPRMLRLIARHADWWNVSWTGIEKFRQEVKECEQACAAVGRDPATLRRTWFGGSLCAPTEEKLAELNVNGMTSANAFVGTPEQVIEQMRPFIDLGVDYFMLGWGGFPDLTNVEMLAHRVLPVLNN